MEQFPRIVVAVRPGDEKRFYLVDQNLDFIPEVKDLIDQKVNTKRSLSPNTLKALCIRLRWYYRFLDQRKLNILEVKPPDLSDFLLWLSNPYRNVGLQPAPLQASTINQINYTVASLYKFLVRRGHLSESPVLYETVPRFWSASAEHDLLGPKQRGGVVHRMEAKLKEPKSNVKTVAPADFEQFLHRIHVGKSPSTDPFGFRDRLMMVMFRESGLRCGEMLGIRMEDLDFAANGIWVRFRPDNENGSRAKAGYERDRFVDLPAEVLGLLDMYLTEIWVNANSRSDYLWLVLKRNAVNGDGQKTFGTALTQTAVNEMFAYYSKCSGIKIHPHMLRHTHATDLVRSYLSKGEPVDWKFVADRLGHSTVVTTMQTYVHLTKEDGKKAYKMYLKKKEEVDAKRRQSKCTPA